MLELCAIRLMWIILKTDFNVATANGASGQGHSAWFASSKFYLNQTRHPMDDLESLVFSLWYVAGVQWDKPSLLSLRRPEGLTLAECKINGTAHKKMTVSTSAKSSNKMYL